MNKIKIVTLFLLITACNTFKHQQTKALQFFSDHPERGAQYCAETFVEKDSTAKPDSVFGKASNIDYTKRFDSLNAVIDSLSNSYIVVTDSNCIDQYNKLLSSQQFLKQKISSLQHDYKPCRPDTLKIYDTTFTKDPGLLASVAYLTHVKDSLNGVITITKTQLQDSKKTSSSRGWVILALSLVAAGSIFLNFKKL